MARSGFTLIELLIVTVIIGLLASIAAVKAPGMRDRAVRASMISDLRNLVNAQEAYYAENNDYAGTGGGNGKGNDLVVRGDQLGFVGGIAGDFGLRSGHRGLHSRVPGKLI